MGYIACLRARRQKRPSTDDEENYHPIMLYNCDELYLNEGGKCKDLIILLGAFAFPPDKVREAEPTTFFDIAQEAKGVKCLAYNKLQTSKFNGMCSFVFSLPSTIPNNNSKRKSIRNSNWL